MACLIQWNCRGLMANRDEIRYLLNTYAPAALCLQETMLSQQTIINYKYYASYNISKQSNDRPSGGVAVLISSFYPHSHIILNTNLQAVAIRLSLHKIISVCSIYLPPNTPLDKAELSVLIDQLPRPAMLLGDFNAHNSLWGSSHMTPRGKQIEVIIGDQDLCFLNDA